MSAGGEIDAFDDGLVGESAPRVSCAIIGFGNGTKRQRSKSQRSFGRENEGTNRPRCGSTNSVESGMGGIPGRGAQEAPEFMKQIFPEQGLTDAQIKEALASRVGVT